MSTPTIDCLVQMVLREVPIISQGSKSPRYLIGATARGQLTLQGAGTDSPTLGAGDMIFLRNDAHVEGWVMSSGPDPLDLLVVVRRPDEADGGEGDARGVTPSTGYHPKLPQALFSDAMEVTEVSGGSRRNNVNAGESSAAGAARPPSRRSRRLRGKGKSSAGTVRSRGEVARESPAA